jgi:hypothetical protein
MVLSRMSLQLRVVSGICGLDYTMASGTVTQAVAYSSDLNSKIPSLWVQGCARITFLTLARPIKQISLSAQTSV